MSVGVRRKVNDDGWHGVTFYLTLAPRRLMSEHSVLRKIKDNLPKPNFLSLAPSVPYIDSICARHHGNIPTRKESSASSYKYSTKIDFIQRVDRCSAGKLETMSLKEQAAQLVFALPVRTESTCS